MYYLDNASTTCCYESSADIVRKALVEDYFNPSAKYLPALDMSHKLTDCRQAIKETLDALAYDVIFTASATEANNLVLNSACAKNYVSLISIGEHSSIFQTVKNLTENGRAIEFVGLNENGAVDFDEFVSKMTSKVGFVSMMLVSNETGAINDVKKFIDYARSVNPKVLFHIDAVQAYCKIQIDAESLGVDYVTLSGHKIHGPKGVGALVVRNKAKITEQIIGGGQENGHRSGTENLPAVLGFVNSAKIMTQNLQSNFEKVAKFKNDLYNEIVKVAKENNIAVELNGQLEEFSPYILSLSFTGLKAEVLLHALEQKQIYVGTGSACNSKNSGNRILEAMGKTKQEVEGNIRLSFSEETTGYDVSYLANQIIDSAKSLQRGKNGTRCNFN